jgi:hypothetical protein
MSPQISLNLDDLLQVLNKATDRKALRWSQTAEEDTFRAEFGYGMVRIARDPDTARYVLTLVDRDGTILDDFQPTGEGTLLALEGLYKKARRQALQLDEKLKALFDHLKSLAEEP